MSLRKDYFDEDYFKNGIRTHKSLYKDFKWIPSISFSIASTLLKLYPDKSILDFGCAMGYVVYALRLLGIKAYGYDISEYALSNCRSEIKEYLFDSIEKLPSINVVFAKDVLEHVDYSELDNQLKIINGICDEICFVIPLGENGEYRIPEFAYDGSHIIIENEEWWLKKINNAGFRIKRFEYHIEGFKDDWYKRSPYGNCVILAKKEEECQIMPLL